jgi:hypothetical protein
MRQILKNAGVVSSVMFLVALAMCIGGGVPICGWLAWYIGALAVVSMLGMGALVHER